jgi:hypothetical protein
MFALIIGLAVATTPLPPPPLVQHPVSPEHARTTTVFKCAADMPEWSMTFRHDAAKPAALLAVTADGKRISEANRAAIEAALAGTIPGAGELDCLLEAKEQQIQVWGNSNGHRWLDHVIVLHPDAMPEIRQLHR